MRAAAILALVALLPGFVSPQDALGRDLRHRTAFQKANPCPANGKTRGACPGFVVDHIRPLCAGGPDSGANMQWQTTGEAKAKDRLEQAECRAIRRK